MSRLGLYVQVRDTAELLTWISRSRVLCTSHHIPLYRMPIYLLIIRRWFYKSKSVSFHVFMAMVDWGSSVVRRWAVLIWTTFTNHIATHKWQTSGARPPNMRLVAYSNTETIEYSECTCRRVIDSRVHQCRWNREQWLELTYASCTRRENWEVICVINLSDARPFNVDIRISIVKWLYITSRAPGSHSMQQPIQCTHVTDKAPGWTVKIGVTIKWTCLQLELAMWCMPVRRNIALNDERNKMYIGHRHPKCRSVFRFAASCPYNASVDVSTVWNGCQIIRLKFSYVTAR